MLDYFGKKETKGDISEEIMRVNEKEGEGRSAGVDYRRFDKMAKEIENIEREAN